MASLSLSVCLSVSLSISLSLPLIHSRCTTFLNLKKSMDETGGRNRSGRGPVAVQTPQVKGQIEGILHYPHKDDDEEKHSTQLPQSSG